MEYLLANHKPKRLTEEEDHGVENILKEARQYYYKERGLISESEWRIYNEVLESADYPYKS